MAIDEVVQRIDAVTLEELEDQPRIGAADAIRQAREAASGQLQLGLKR